MQKQGVTMMLVTKIKHVHLESNFCNSGDAGVLPGEAWQRRIRLILLCGCRPKPAATIDKLGRGSIRSEPCLYRHREFCAGAYGTVFPYNKGEELTREQNGLLVEGFWLWHRFAWMKFLELGLW
jgi:hypothetical protein